MRTSATFAVVACLVLAAVRLATAHSWVACVDYGREDGEYWDASLCRAYPRKWSLTHSSGFGVDTGFNYQATEAQACRDPMANPITAGYTAEFPMGRFSPGQRVCMAWPSKNHVAAACTNPYIPDTALRIMISPRNPTSDGSLSSFRQNVIADLTGHVEGTIDYKGFQRCPKFCENMDKSFCSQCFNLPSNLQPGFYTLMWYWIFNAGSAPYTTCMDVEILGSSVTGNATTTAAATTTTTTSTTAAATTTTTTSTTAAATTTTSGSATTTTSGSATTSSSSTGSTTGPEPSPGEFVVFGEALASGFTTSWSWQTTVSTPSGNAHKGSVSLQASMQPWAGLQLGAQSGIQWQGRYRYVSFAARASSSTSLNMWFSGGSKQVPLSLTSEWITYNMLLADDMGAPASVFNPAGLIFQNAGPSPVTVYFDEIKLH